MNRHRIGLSIIAWLNCIAITFGQGSIEGRLPVPPIAQRQQALKLARELYKDAYEDARTPAVKAALANEILTVAQDTENDPSSKFALLQVARQIAIESGDAELAFAATREHLATFVDDDLDKLVDAGSALQKTANKSGQGIIAEEMLAIAERAVSVDRYEVALKAAHIAETSSKKARNAALTRDAGNIIRDARRIDAAFKALKPVRDVLKAMPEDAAARHRFGWFLCIIKGDWERGLPYVATGDDTDLSELAGEELGERPNALSIADGWWGIAVSLKGEEKANIEYHAASWYRLALPELSGIQRAKAESRAKVYSPKPRVLKRLEGHGDLVLDVRFSPSGTLLATTDLAKQGTIKIWNPASGEQVQSWVGHEGGVHCVDFSPDGRTIASSGYKDGTIRLWDVKDGRQIRLWKTTGNTVRTVKFSADGDRLITAQYDNGRARVWETVTGRLLAEIPHVGAWFAQFESSGTRCLVSGKQGVMRWDLRTNRVIAKFILSNTKLSVVSLALSPRSRDLMAGASREGVHFWSLSHPSTGRLFAPHPTTTNVQFTPDGKRIVSVGLDNAVRVWDVRSGRLIHVYDNVGRMRLDIAPDGRTVVSANDNTVYLLKLPE